MSDDISRSAALVGDLEKAILIQDVVAEITPLIERRAVHTALTALREYLSLNDDDSAYALDVIDNQIAALTDEEQG